ncbi:MAG: alpha-amylase family glycosyl hydrolase, partial [Acutalibacteraceae bacterium]|nr:alpha-amylase family glycosyl hydrolase [Acutalibacteraceae bacterium]
ITPVVTNASGYDYHGYHAFDFSTVDVRYESDGATYQDLINAAHAKGMKIVQDVVFQHTGNFGEATFAPLFEKRYNTLQDLANIETSMIPTDTLLNAFGLNSAEEYYAQLPGVQYDQRLLMMKQTNVSANNSTSSPLEDVNSTDKVSNDPVYNSNNYYHNGYWQSLNWDDWTCKYAQIAGDCVDLNTENPAVAEKLVELYGNYIGMGVDAFRVDTARHISRLSLNTMFNKQLNAIGGDSFYMFGEVCCRFSQVWYRDHASESVPFYTWDEPDDSYTSQWKWSTDADSVNHNMNLTLQHWKEYDDTSNQPTSDNAFLNGNEYHTPDYSESSGMGAIDFLMHWQFDSASGAFGSALAEDKYFNDSTWNVVYVDSHDYAPDRNQKERFTGGTQTWAENMCLMFTFRGIPCLYYGSEVEFQKGMVIDVGPNAPLSTTGRAYFGDYLEGDVSTTDFGEYTASGTVADTLNSTLSQQLVKLNKIRRAIPALQKGQYSVTGVTGDMAFKRGYTDPDSGEKSFACVAVTNAATFKNIPNGTYIDAVTGDTKTVTNGTLTVSASGKGNCRVYVLSSNGYTGIDGQIGGTTNYLK